MSVNKDEKPTTPKKVRLAHVPRDYDHKYKEDTDVVYEKSLGVDVKGEDTLFCDTEFLEQIFKKPVKKSEDCE